MTVWPGLPLLARSTTEVTCAGYAAADNSFVLDHPAPPNSAENGCWLLAISQFHTEMGKGGVENPIPLSTENVGVETTQQYRMGADHLS